MRKRRKPQQPKVKQRKLPEALHKKAAKHAKSKPKPPPVYELGVFADSGVQFVNPATGPLGPVEHMAGLARAGYAYASFEVFDGTGRKDWSIWHREAERNYLRQLPWARCRDRLDILRLCDIAGQWRQPPIVNLEDEAAGDLPPRLVAELVGEHWGGEYAVQTLAILYDSVDWSPLNGAGAVCILEAYANERPELADWRYLLARAKPDFDRVVLSPGLYSVNGVYPTRDLYAGFPAPWCDYTGDNVTDWVRDWRAP